MFNIKDHKLEFMMKRFTQYACFVNLIAILSCLVYMHSV